jgi:multiple sugar transport system permease protein
VAVTGAALERSVPRRRRRVSGATRLGVALFSPALIYIAALLGLPLALAFLYSVGDVTVGSVGYGFVGLENFRSVIQSPSFRRALANSFVFTIASQVVVIVCANALALALRDRFRGRGFVRFLILLPWSRPSASAPSAGSGSSTRSTPS